MTKINGIARNTARQLSIVINLGSIIAATTTKTTIIEKIPSSLILKNLSNRTFFIGYSVLLSYYAYSYWFLDSGLGVGVDLFELSIGLWISTEILIKLPNFLGRFVAAVTVLVVMQLFGIDVVNLIINIEDGWKSFLNLIPIFIPNINSNVQRTYTPWAFLGYISFYSAFWIREIGMPNHPWCNPDSLLQAHMVWHLLCAVATISFFNFQRTEKLNKI